LVEGALRGAPPFLQHNLGLVAEIEALQNRSRRRDLVVDDRAMFAFYDARIPGHVASERSFDAWRKDAEAKDPRLLFTSRNHLLPVDASDITEESFPSQVLVSGIDVPLSYRFEPGPPEDGVTAILPLPALHRFEPAPFDWAVPGLLREKIATLLES